MSAPKNNVRVCEYSDTVLIHPGNSVVQPDVFVAQGAGERVLVKDYTPRPLLVRLLFGRKVLRHEHKMLVKLDGTQGIPRAFGMPEPDVLLMEFIEGHDLRDGAETEDRSPLSLQFFGRLQTAVTQMHARGVSHGDIRRQNILRGTDGAAYLIDFATAVSTTGRCGWLRRWLFRACRKSDIYAVLKLKRRYFPDSLSEEETRLLERAPWYLKLGRFMRKRVYRSLIKQRTWKRRLRRLKNAVNDPE